MSIQQVNKHKSQTQAIKQSGKTKTEKLDKANLMGNNSNIDRKLGQELCTTYNQSSWIVAAGKPMQHYQSSRASDPFLVSTKTSIKECCNCQSQWGPLNEQLYITFAQGSTNVCKTLAALMCTHHIQIRWWCEIRYLTRRSTQWLDMD